MFTHTVYRHHFSHHFDLFVLLQPQSHFCETTYVGCLYGLLRCIGFIFVIYLQIFTMPKSTQGDGQIGTPNGHFHTHGKWAEVPLAMCIIHWKSVKEVNRGFGCDLYCLCQSLVSCIVDHTTMGHPSFKISTTLYFGPSICEYTWNLCWNGRVWQAIDEAIFCTKSK